MPADTNPLGLPAVIAISVGEVIVTVAATKEDAVTTAEPVVEVIAMVMSAKAIGGIPAATTEMAIVAASGAVSAKTAASQVAATHVTAAAEGAASVAAMASSAIAGAEAAATTVATTTATAASAAIFGKGIVG